MFKIDGADKNFVYELNDLGYNAWYCQVNGAGPDRSGAHTSPAEIARIARLFAASQDMLEALEEFVRCLAWSDEIMDSASSSIAYEAAVKIIKQVKGELG